MPSSATITSFYNFTALTVIRSAQVNTNFDTFRGHLLPVDPSTATAATTMTYDLGSIDHMWRGAFNQYGIMYANTAGSAPTVPTSTAYALYFKSDGNLYKKNSSGTETQIDQAAPSTPTIQKFTSGTGTYTTPANTRYLRVRMVGGGGGGSGSGTASIGSGGNGGNTTFGTTLLAANGGNGGPTGASASGGTGGTASLGTGPIGTALQGGSGGGGYYIASSGTQMSGGVGGVSFFGGAASGGEPAGANGTAGKSAVANSGSGGGGASNGTTSLGYSGTGGGAGGFVDALIVGPSATYSYVVGVGGSIGSAGTNGATGGAGGSGYIEVTEYY